MSRQNTKELWDRYWKRTRDEDDESMLDFVENSSLWRAIETVVLSHFGSFRHLRVIELGGGRGAFSGAIAKRGADVTLLDFSSEGIDRAKVFFEKHSLPARFMLMDLLDLDQSLFDTYDVSMSFGLAEHFRGRQRTEVLRAHFRLLRGQGMTLIAVPDKFNLAYRAYKIVLESMGRFLVEEHPFSEKEIREACERIGGKDARVLPLCRHRYESLTGMLHYLDRKNFLRRVFPFVREDDLDSSRIGADWRFVHHVKHLFLLYAKKEGDPATR